MFNLFIKHRYAECHIFLLFAECRYAECRYAESHGAERSISDEEENLKTIDVRTESFVLVLRSLTTFVILISLLFLAHLIVQHHPIVNILYLAYP
jgi:hypothetical protein